MTDEIEIRNMIKNLRSRDDLDGNIFNVGLCDDEGKELDYPSYSRRRIIWSTKSVSWKAQETWSNVCGYIIFHASGERLKVIFFPSNRTLQNGDRASFAMDYAGAAGFSL